MTNPQIFDPHCFESNEKAPAYARGLQPSEALLGLACRRGFATMVEAAPAQSGRSDDLLIPQGPGCWTNSCLAQLGTAPNVNS